MKRCIILICCIALISNFSAFGQAVTEKDFEPYMSMLQSDDNGNPDWIASALKLKEQISLDKNNQISFVTIIDSLNMPKDRIYIEANQWFTQSFNDGSSVIQLNDKTSGVILAKGYLKCINSRSGFAVNTEISAWLIVRIDIKDNRVRVSTTIQHYDFLQSDGTGLQVMSALAGSYTPSRPVNNEINPLSVFPYSEKRQNKKEGAKAFVSCCMYSWILVDKLEKAIRNGIIGGENEDW